MQKSNAFKSLPHKRIWLVDIEKKDKIVLYTSNKLISKSYTNVYYHKTFRFYLTVQQQNTLMNIAQENHVTMAAVIYAKPLLDCMSKAL